MRELEEIEISILEAIRDGRVTRVPSESEDSGHTAWLLEKGYAEFAADVLVLTDLGRKALAGT
ncbi:MAG: hypothetical protein IT374_03230 [Polyangiaceae bacterium]|nr:hypothetical protein [Polyangiaceae bacterium]